MPPPGLSLKCVHLGRLQGVDHWGADLQKERKDP